ncbi:MAG: hypothetical protein WBQ18_20440, partial [Solirubrobacteraceae bacterium]
RWRTLLAATHRTRLTFAGVLGRTYQFRVAALTAAGTAGSWGTAITVVPSAARVPGGHYSRGWAMRARRGAWRQHAIQTTTRGAALTLRYRGGALALIGETTGRGGVMRVTLDGVSRLVSLHSRRLHRRRVIFSVPLRAGAHRLRIVDVHGLVALEGVAIAARSR